MVKFLLQRPIAVLMAFTACFIIGLVTYFSLPVSLLPDIAIPQITIQVSGENSSARELENTVVTPVRRQLLQVAGLREIKSETRDGAGVIRMEFEFGVNTDLAFIEVNEKIDAAMNSLPKEVARPKAIKASATDIPVFYLNMTLKNDRPYEGTNEQQFLDMCELAELAQTLKGDVQLPIRCGNEVAVLLVAAAYHRQRGCLHSSEGVVRHT